MDPFTQSATTKEELGLLAIMEAIQEQNHLSQRELAKKTGLNLKKVNFCLHKLLEKGYVKFQKVRKNPDKRVYLYILTAAGLRAKSVLTYKFLSFTLDFYNEVEKKLAATVSDLRANQVERILLFGISDLVRILLGILGDQAPQVVGIIDESAQANLFHMGIRVYGEDEIGSVDWDRILITHLEDVSAAEARLVSNGVDRQSIVVLS